MHHEGGLIMTIQRGSYLIGVFDDQKHAVEAMQALQAAGFTDRQLNLVSRESVPAAQDRATVDLQEKAGKGATIGAVVGGGVGAAAGAAAAALLPPLAPFVAGGLLAGILGGGALGAAVGTFAGPFVALGLSEGIAHHYAHHVEAGRTVVVVQASNRVDAARTILQKHGAYDDSMNTD